MLLSLELMRPPHPGISRPLASLQPTTDHRILAAAAVGQHHCGIVNEQTAATKVTYKPTLANICRTDEEA